MTWESWKKKKSFMRKDKGDFTQSKESRHLEQFAPAAGVLFLPLIKSFPTCIYIYIFAKEREKPGGKQPKCKHVSVVVVSLYGENPHIQRCTMAPQNPSLHVWGQL